LTKSSFDPACRKDENGVLMLHKIVTIAAFDNLFEAELAKGLLEDNGIEASLENELVMSIYPFFAWDLKSLKLNVRECDSEKALSLLRSGDDAEFTYKMLLAEDAILEGHFKLTSGRHSAHYVEKVRILQNPQAVKSLCRRLIERFKGYEIDAVVGPAYGGIALAFELARQLEKPFVFTQRKEEQMVIRSGFDISNIHRVLIMEDIITTGGSIREVIACLQKQNISVQAIAAVVDRSGGTIDFGFPLEALLTMDISSWEPQECELCKQGIALSTPGRSDK